MAILKEEELTGEAKRLKEFRVSEGLNQDKFCEPLSITRSVLSRYEQNYLNIPIDFIKELHEVYNLSYQWFFTGHGSRKHIEGKTNLVKDISTLITSHNLLQDQVTSLKAELLKLHRDFHAIKANLK